jgi:hypothetical protein
MISVFKSEAILIPSIVLYHHKGDIEACVKALLRRLLTMSGANLMFGVIRGLGLKAHPPRAVEIK